MVLVKSYNQKSHKQGENKPFSLSTILKVARIHPLYVLEIEYPPTPQQVKEIVESTQDDFELASQQLQRLPLATKKLLYTAIERLSGDTKPENTYRQGCYLSITGGGSGGVPMLFATDAWENRMHRARMGAFIKACGLVEQRDWALSTHASGDFYRSLDLMCEMLENAGVSTLSAGNNMAPADVAEALLAYRINLLAGDGSQIIRMVHYISTLPPEKRQLICINKIIYTSEPLTAEQRAYIPSVLGPEVKIFSILGSSEAGPWAVGNSYLSGPCPSDASDFIFDTRSMIIEIMPRSVLEHYGDKVRNVPGEERLPDGTPGIIIQTSLDRLRNPLVRYVTGDIGSLHPLSQAATAALADEDAQYFKVLRLYGRDRRFSFKWYAMYFEFGKVSEFMQTAGMGILQWQLILGEEQVITPTLEVRVFRSNESSPGERMTDEELAKAIDKFFYVLDENRGYFKLRLLKDQTEFVRSSTGQKVIRFVDRNKVEEQPSGTSGVDLKQAATVSGQRGDSEDE